MQHGVQTEHPDPRSGGSEKGTFTLPSSQCLKELMSHRDHLVFTAGCTKVQEWRAYGAGGEEHGGWARGASRWHSQAESVAVEVGTARPAGERHFSKGRSWIRPQLFNNNLSDAQEHMRISQVQKATEQWRTGPAPTSGAQEEPPVLPG